MILKKLNIIAGIIIARKPVIFDGQYRYIITTAPDAVTVVQSQCYRKLCVHTRIERFISTSKAPWDDCFILRSHERANIKIN
jgi:hypothetical protein